MDRLKFTEECQTALGIEVDPYNKVIVDFEGDLEKYRDLDGLITINPLLISDEEKVKLLHLCEICPGINISDNLVCSNSTVEEYKNGELWIESILKELKPEWSDIQKVAFIDNAIGKKISYSPDFETEVFDFGGARALWKIITSGYGVCNGIAQVESYILNRIGINVEIISSGIHAFLKLNDIEIPTATGEFIKGDTLLDPTWNIAAHRYGGKPENFCRSYEQMRTNDITSDGKDSKAHDAESEDSDYNGDLKDVTLDLDEKSLRQIFTSIGIADKNGNFPIIKLIDSSKAADDLNLPEEESIKKQVLLLAEYYPEFATCQNSTICILKDVLLDNENLKFNKCVANRVYNRSDIYKNPVLYVYVNFPKAGKKFYFADKDTREFIELTQNEFEKKFECYKTDLQESKGIRPWEDSEKEEKTEDLTKSSGKIVAGRRRRKMNFIKKIYLFVKKIFNKENNIKMIKAPQKTALEQGNISFMNYLKTDIVKKHKKKEVETKSCVGDGLGIQNKINF